MNKGLISIVVPVYNVEEYLEQCVESLINQTYTNLEIILVDDGSKDSSGMMCDEVGLRDKRIVVLHKENGGLSDARNAGIEIACGEYITFIDSDDVVDLNYCELLYKALYENNADIAVCNTVLFCDELPDEVRDSSIHSYNQNEVIEAFLLGKIRPMAWGKLYKKDIFTEIRYPVGKTTEDVYVIVEILLKCNRVLNGVGTNYYYRQRRNSIQYSGSVNTKNIIEAHTRNYELLINTEYSQLAKERMLFSYLDASNMMIRNNACDKENLDKCRKMIKDNKREMVASRICTFTKHLLLELFMYAFPVYKKVYKKHFDKLISKLS